MDTGLFQLVNHVFDEMDLFSIFACLDCTDGLAVVPAPGSLLLVGPPTSSLSVKFEMDRSD